MSGKSLKGDTGISPDKSYSVNDVVYIVRGVIVGNPFVYRMEGNEASYWMVENREKVENTIKRRFYELGVSGGVVEDCYNMLLYELSTRKDLIFNKDYFGQGSEYTLEGYVLGRVRYIVKKYKNELLKRKDVSILNSDEAEAYSGISTEVLAGRCNVEDVVEEDLYYWDSLFKELVIYFKSFLEKRGYIEVDYERLVTELYFNVQEDFTYEEETDIKAHYKRVAGVVDKSVDYIETVNIDLNEAVRGGDEVGTKILTKVKELLKGKYYGWQPRLLRRCVEDGNIEKV